MIAEGRYEGRIERAWCEMDKNNDLVMCFEVQVATDDGTETTWPRQFTSEKSRKHAQRVAEHLAIAWPSGLKDINACAGRDVEVSVKHNTKDGRTYANSYIVTAPMNEPATPEQVDAAVAKLESQTKEDDEGLLF